MKIFLSLLSASMLMLTSCSQNTRMAENKKVLKPMFAIMQMKNKFNAGDPLTLKFTVYNPSASVQQFCKWHTPFEPLMSKYLDVREEKGEEVAYHGPMAKRRMPPPAESYLKINPGDSLSIDVDLLKAYTIKNVGRYIVKFSGNDISGLVVTDSVIFVYAGQ